MKYQFIKIIFWREKLPTFNQLFDNVLEELLSNVIKQDINHRRIRPWGIINSAKSRIHRDVYESLYVKQLLIVMDSISKWLEKNLSTIASATIDVLQEMFSTHHVRDVVFSKKISQFIDPI